MRSLFAIGVIAVATLLPANAVDWGCGRAYRAEVREAYRARRAAYREIVRERFELHRELARAHREMRRELLRQQRAFRYDRVY